VKLGIDEAGRGSLVGPMIVAGVALDSSGEERLRSLGVRDSKTLSAGKRGELLEAIIGEAKFIGVIPVGPEDIDRANLNRLTLEAAWEIIEKAAVSIGVETVVLDRVGKSFKTTADIAGRRIQIVAEERADAKYTVVSAASIVAKVFRDWAIKMLRSSYGIKGSGYPSDFKTLSWVRESLSKVPDWVIRHKWKTLKGLYSESRRVHRVLDEFTDEKLP